jgi:hypothetical protein
MRGYTRVTNPRPHPFLLLIILVLVLAGAGGGCAGGAMAPGAPQAEGRPSEAMASAPMAAPPPPPGGAKMDEEVSGKERKPAEKEAKTWKRSQLGAHTVRVKIGDRDELPVRSMQANVTLDGFMARVVLDLVVKNDRGGTYEGTLQLRLPEGASPYFFAFGEQVLAVAGDAPAFFPADKARGMGSDPVAIMAGRADAWRGPKEARMVPKEQAALAYRDTVQRAVDPALLEWSGPSVFSARVFPLSANRSHRIVVGYDVPLTRIGGDLEYTFDLPEKVERKVVDIAVAAPAGASLEATPKAAPTPGAGRSFFRFEDPAAKELSIRVKKPAPAHLVSADGAYFAADVTPALAATAAARGSEAALFLVDTSLSSNPDRMNVWLKLVEAILRNNRDTLKQFNVLFFNVEQSFWKQGFAANDDASLADLRAHAGALALEGATDLGAALRRAASPPGGAARWDLFLLSDGAATWGESDPFVMTRALAKGGAGAVYAYQTGLAGTDIETLSVLARETGGAVFSVTGDAEVKSASTAHRARPLRLVDAKVAGGSDLLLAGRPRFVYPGQMLRLVGRGRPDKGAELELTLDADGAPRAVRVPIGDALTSTLAMRAYGQVAVAQLEELLPATEKLSPAYARRFRVTGKTCSLLMLESEADYQRFGIRPEDDATAVGQSPAARVVADTLAQIAGTLGDPKRAFLGWLHELPRRAGVAVDLPQGFQAAIERVPEAGFRVDAAPLAVVHRDRASIPDPVQKALASHQLDYDLFSAEAARRLRAGGPADALKALSSMVEESPGDAVLGRDVGMSALAWGMPAEGFHLFRRVATARPYEPPTYRALAQSLVRLGKIDLAMAYFEVALAGRWAARFGDFRKIVAIEYLELLRRIQSGELKTGMPEFARDRYAAVTQEVQLGHADLVVMITWNTDATDVDLHVVEPGGEECYYGHRYTASGGQITQDVTQGYGPEMYVLPRAPAGKYEIRAKYFASDRNRTSARTKVSALIFEDWGTPRQRVTEKTVVLEYGKQMHDLLTVSRGASLQVAKP